MADGRHIEKPLNRRSSVTVPRSIMKFGRTTHFDPLKPSDRQYFEFEKSKMADGRHLKNH